MRIDLNCPVELWRSELHHGDSPACDMMFYNLSDTVVTSVEVTLILQGGDEEQRIISRARDLDGRPQTAFAMTAPLEKDDSFTGVEVLIEKVWFSTGIVWRRGKDSLVEYTSNRLPTSLQLEQLRFVAGKGAVGFPEEQEQVWLCACGRPNALNEKVCVRCHQSRQKVFTEYSREAVERANRLRQQQLSLQTKAVREENSRRQAEREKEYYIRRARKRKIIAITAVVVTLLGAGFSTWQWGLPYLRYRNAVKTMEQGDLTAARAAFEAMPGYADADDRARQCLYGAAVADMESEDVALLAAAADTFRSIPDYEDAAANALVCDFRRAGLLMDTDRPAAAALYRELARADYPGAADMVTQCAYLDACDLMDAGNYAAARSAFLTLSGWSDADDRAARCLYLPAVSAIEDGDFDTAIDLLTQLPAGYDDADTQLARARYGKGVSLCEAGELKEAGMLFLACGDYQDAPEQANTCLYTLARQTADAGHWMEAAELYALIPGYEDAVEQFRTCTYKAAGEAVAQKEYALAVRLLEQLPASYEDTLELRQQCIYQPALAALKAGRWEEAIEGFAQLTTYSDGA